MKKNEKKVAITGATGFLGRFVVKKFLDEGYQVRCLIRNELYAKECFGDTVEIIKYDIEDLNSIKKAISGCNIVIHTAAIHNRKLISKNETYDINIKGTKNLLDASDSLEAFVFISSIRSIMNSKVTIITEDTDYDFEQYDTPYGSSKHLAEDICIEYYKSKSIPLYIVNPAPLIGPEDYRISHNGKMISDHLNKRIVPYTNALWPIVDVRDVADVIPFIIENGKLGERHILCSANLTLKIFYQIIDKYDGKNKIYIPIPHLILRGAAIIFEIIEKIYPTFEPPIVSSSVDVAEMGTMFSGEKIKKMGFKYRNVDETIADTVNWFLNHKNS